MLGTVPPLIPLEAEYDECRTLKFPGLGLIHSPSTHLDPSSTRPRPTVGQQRSKACTPLDHVGHCSATDPPRGRIRRVSYPEIPGARPYPFPVDPRRPVLDPTSTNRRSTKKQGLHATGPGVFSPSHPLCHHGVRGWPAIPGEVATAASTALDKNFTSKASPGVSASS
jgi:hypothetical protein